MTAVSICNKKISWSSTVQCTVLHRASRLNLCLDSVLFHKCTGITATTILLLFVIIITTIAYFSTTAILVEHKKEKKKDFTWQVDRQHPTAAPPSQWELI